MENYAGVCAATSELALQAVQRRMTMKLIGLVSSYIGALAKYFQTGAVDSSLGCISWNHQTLFVNLTIARIRKSI